MAANDNRPQPSRLRYFNGLIMKEEEFIHEQDYHVRMRRLHNRNLHDGGIIIGLEVDIGNTSNEVLVRQGIALDRHFDPKFSEDVSRELVLTDDCEVDLSSYSPGDQVWIWISYAEEFVDVVPDRGGTEPIHIQESVVINHSTTEPPNRDAEDIPLAIVEIGPGGVVNEEAIKDNLDGELIREKSALKTDRLNVEVLSLRDPEINDENTPSLDGFKFTDTGDNGIVVNSDRTRFSAAVDVDTRLTVGTDATVQGNAQIDQDLTVTGNVTVVGNFAGRLPLGGVVAVFDYGNNLPAATNDITGDGFMRADGQPLPATTALYTMADGNALPTTRPDLTNDVFLMGATTSGNTGGANSVTVTIPAHNHADIRLDVTGQDRNIAISGTTDGYSNSHTHTYNYIVPFLPGGGGYSANPGLLQFPNTSGASANHTHSFSGNVFLDGLGVAGEVGPLAVQSGDTSMNADAHENRPNYISAVYLVRVN